MPLGSILAQTPPHPWPCVPLSNCSWATLTTPPSAGGPLCHSCSSGTVLSSLSLHFRTTPRLIQRSRFLLMLSRSHCPLDLIPGLPGPLCPLSLPSGLLGPRCPLGPTSGAVSLPLYPRSAHLRPWLSPSAPAGPPNNPSSALHAVGPRPAAASPPPGHQPPWSSSSTLPPSSLPHGRLDTHYSLSSTMSLRGSAAACCQFSLPPAS